MKFLHLLAGLSEASGVANIARRFVRVQQERGDMPVMLAPAIKWNPIYFGWVFAFRTIRQVSCADEIWVHCSWTFPVWWGAWLAKRMGKRLVVVPEGSFDPKRIHNKSEWKKRLVSPLDRWVLRSADEVLALCREEMSWVKAFEPQAKVRLEYVPIFFNDGESFIKKVSLSQKNVWHVLFLGRISDPLKGVRFLREVENKSRESNARTLIVHYVSNKFGVELEQEWLWCDVLCLPTLSDNFGLVVAEALEHGKYVITTDGAPAWTDYFLAHPERGVSVSGFRDGSDEMRVASLKAAFDSI